MGNFASRPRDRIPSQNWNYSEPLIIQTWDLKVNCTCKGCEKTIKEIDGVYDVTIDAAQQKVTFTGTVTSADVLLKKLQKSGKHVELWSVAQSKQQNEAKTQKQREKQGSVEDVGGDKKKHVAMAQSETQKKKPKNPNQQTDQKAGRYEDNGQDTSFRYGPIKFKRETLEDATNNFHCDNKLGEGGFGPVYEGTTKDGGKIAVKKLSEISNQGWREFLNEVKPLAQIQHRNLVKLRGYCREGSQMLLVYEYLQNGSLDKFLSDADKRKDLDWNKRCNIILGIARGLRYLHEDSQPRIVHLDIKASNILLDEKMNPKIADFGLAKLFPEDKTHVSTVDGGTHWYMAPEHAMGGPVSEKADVYSFGVVLLELVTGKKILSEMGKLLRWVWSSFEQGESVQTIDPAIIETCDKNQALRFIHVALLCIQTDILLRPPMSEVTNMLSIPSVALPDPTKPLAATM